MIYKFKNIKIGSSYENEVNTYTSEITDGEKTFVTIFSKSEFETLKINENLDYKFIKSNGLLFDSEIDFDNKVITSNYGNSKSIEIVVMLSKIENEYIANFEDKNLQINNIEIVNPRLISETKNFASEKFKLKAKVLRIDITEVR